MRTEEEINEAIAILAFLYEAHLKANEKDKGVNGMCVLQVLLWVLEKPSTFGDMFLEPVKKKLAELEAEAESGQEEGTITE